jgi:hypothetical protein
MNHQQFTTAFSTYEETFGFPMDTDSIDLVEGFDPGSPEELEEIRDQLSSGEFDAFEFALTH